MFIANYDSCGPSFRASCRCKVEFEAFVAFRGSRDGLVGVDALVLHFGSEL